MTIPGSRAATRLRFGFWLAASALALPLGALASPRPLHQPVAHALLQELAELEAENAAHGDQDTAPLMAQPITATRQALLQVLSGALPLPQALQTTLANLQVLAGYQQRIPAGGSDEARQHLSASIERLRHQAELANSAAFTNSAPAATAASSALTSAPPRAQLGKAAFEGLLRQLQRLSFSDEKLTLAREAASGGAVFSCDQVGQLMRTMAFGEDQVKLAAALYPQVVDPQNFAQLAAILTLDSDRQKLRQLAGR